MKNHPLSNDEDANFSKNTEGLAKNIRYYWKICFVGAKVGATELCYRTFPNHWIDFLIVLDVTMLKFF